jgi:predicted phosphoribosyltransferase
VGRDGVIVLGLPRGGVPVAFEAAKALGAPLDVFLVRKLGVPGHDELAMGAIASGGVRVLNDSVVGSLAIPEAALEEVTARERKELERRERAYRGGRSGPALGGRRIILVDDGLATGATMRAAVKALRAHEPARIVVAVPTAPPDAIDDLREEADEVVCLHTPAPFYGVGGSYDDFSQTSDEEVRELLARADSELRQGNQSTK